MRTYKFERRRRARRRRIAMFVLNFANEIRKLR